MAEYKLQRDPLATEVVLVFNETTRNIYHDAKVKEQLRIKKFAKVKKEVDMAYVQELPDLLMEENETPWIVSLTNLNLPRIPAADDMICINGIRYTISYILPKNRKLPWSLSLLIYPERTHFEEALGVTSHRFIKVNSRDEVVNLKDFIGKEIVLDLVCSGEPISMEVNGESRVKFCSYIPVTVTEVTEKEGKFVLGQSVVLFDEKEKEVTLQF